MTEPFEPSRQSVDLAPGRAGGWPAPTAGGLEPSVGRSTDWPAKPTADDRPWGWRDLWRHGGSGAVLVVFGALWLLVALWMVSSGAPSADGIPPEIVIVDPAQPPGDS